MDSKAIERKILGYENKLLHPTAQPIPLPLDFLRSITSNFCDEQELGRGGYGVVYKGILPCGSVIAIKKFHESTLMGDERSFENEASFLMDIKHQNVVQLLGFCDESRGAMMMKQSNGKGIFVHQQTRVLCFEYMSNGGLDKYLTDESSGLEWNMRYKIIKGICSGLEYLHGRNITHLDLKPQNILMDTNMVPKIADFGLSRFLGEQISKIVTSNCRGTTGYMAPEYIDRGVISKKADIFSLGVIIIEILKGCKDDYPDHGRWTEIDSQHFTEKVLSNWRNRFERSLKYTPSELHTQLVKQCIDIALKCVHPEKEERPNVSNIIEILNAAEESCYGQNGEDLPVHHQSVKICRNDGLVPPVLRERVPRPDVVTRCIGSKEGYTNLIMELRRKLPSPQDPVVVVDDILGENPGAYPVLRRQSARASRWLWVELEAVVGQQTFTTTLAVRDDNVYCKGFRNQRGVWYELSGERSIQNCPMLPSSGEWGDVVQLPGWDASYSSILRVDSRELVEDILNTGLGKAFAATAVRRLAQYPVVDGRDDYLTRLSLVGLIVMVCEPARFNVVLDTFVGGWDSGTGLTRRLAGYMWEWKDMSHGLLQWRTDGYWPRAYRTTRQLVQSAGHALAHIHLVLNYNTNPKDAQGCYNLLHGGSSRGNNPEQDKGGPASRGPWSSRQHRTNNTKQASGSTKHDNAPSEPGEGDRQRQRQSLSPEETLPGDPGHPGEDDNAHQGSEQPGEDDSSQQRLDKISERYGRPRVEIFAVRANFHVTNMTISVFDGIRGQIIYMPKEKGEQPEAMEVEEMNDLILTGPYRGISAYGNFAIQVDMSSSATGGSSGDASGPITWEWDRYNPEHAAQIDAREPVTHAISLDSWRKINVTYLVMSNAVEAAVKVNLPEMPQDYSYLPHEKDQGEAKDHRGSKHTAHGTITAHIDGFDKYPIVLFTSAVEVPIPSESLTLPLARPAIQIPQGKRLHIDMADLHIAECSSNREVKKPADSDSLSFQFGHVSPTPQFNNDTEEVEVNVTWRPQQNKDNIHVKPHQVCIIGDKEDFSAFIGNLRRVLADHPDREDALGGGTELAGTGEHPVLTRPRAKQPQRWIHIELQVVAGHKTWSTTLAVRDDKCYGVGFVSQSGVWYDLGNRRGDRALPPEYNSVLLDWGVSYKDILHVSSWDEVVEELDSARPGKDFAQKAVRTLSSYPYVQEGDNTRLAVAGLFVMVCESAKFNPLRKHFLDGWDNGTGFPHQLIHHIRNWGHISRALLRSKDELDYYLRPQPVGISDPQYALDVLYLVFNNREAISSGNRKEAPSNQVRSPANNTKPETERAFESMDTKYIPVVRSGGWADIGSRNTMEDVFICSDNFMQDFGFQSSEEGPSAFYGVFDGHGGKHAADFVCNNLPRFIVEDEGFPREIVKAVSSAFLQADAAFADACSLNCSLASGTTALAALVVGRSLLVANAGDCRAVLCRRGKAIEMSRDHKPSCNREKMRIEALGGYVDDGYLNGQLHVARAIGDWHMEGMKACNGLGPLSAEPEIMTMDLTEEDEFLIMGCYGIWDVFQSQNAVDFARCKLQEHNDPASCCKELVDEAIKRKSGDNLSVVVICFNSRPPPVLTTPRPHVQRSISAGIAVSVTMGVMKPVLEKLSMLMGDEYKKIKGLRKEVSFLRDELSGMDALLQKMDAADILDSQAREWRKHIIDMSYDIEDCIDDFMHRVGEPRDKVGILQKASSLLRTIKDRYRIAKQINKIKTRVIQASQRRERYKVDVSNSTPTPVVVDPRLSALYIDSATLVGLENQKEELVKWIMDEEQQLKVMSIVGFAGLGKTTLANEVLHQVGGKFVHKTLICVSQKPDISKLLKRLLLELGQQQYSQMACCAEQDLVSALRKHLQDKRYFIIIDDLWETEAWDVIQWAFPQNNQRSRVMITTRDEKVARRCCGNDDFIYNMKPLSEPDSRKLFFTRIFGSEHGCPLGFEEVSRAILKRCGGLPLAIITIASIIASQHTKLKEAWDYIQNALAPELETNIDYEKMMYILDLSYKSLPRHLKACFLYLGTYPEDHDITKVELLRRWVAEGFVSNCAGLNVWDVAESYFNELVNRSMIQPINTEYKYMMSHCRVHDMMLDLILRKCKEDNFLILVNDPREVAAEGQDKVIRRLTIDSKGLDDGRCERFPVTMDSINSRRLKEFDPSEDP